MARSSDGHTSAGRSTNGERRQRQGQRRSAAPTANAQHHDADDDDDQQRCTAAWHSNSGTVAHTQRATRHRRSVPRAARHPNAFLSAAVCSVWLSDLTAICVASVTPSCVAGLTCGCSLSTLTSTDTSLFLAAECFDMTAADGGRGEGSGARTENKREKAKGRKNKQTGH